MKAKAVWGCVMMLTVFSIPVFGDGDALYKQGAKLFKSDPGEALELFKQAAQDGSVSAMVGAGHCCENGVGTEVNYAEALRFYESAAQHSMKACEALARIYASCPEPQYHDGGKAVKYAKIILDKKPLDPAAQGLLAAAYVRNFNFEDAAGALEKSLKLQRVPEELREVRVRRIKEGVPLPVCSTDEWLQQAAERDAVWAVRQLAWMYSDSRHPLHDEEKALELCDQGIRLGDNVLGALAGDILLRSAKDDDDLLEVQSCYEKIPKGYFPNNHLGPVQYRAVSFLTSTGEECWKYSQAYRYSESGEYTEVEVGRGGSTTTSVNKYHKAAQPLLAEYLAYLAALKGIEDTEDWWSKKIRRNWNRSSGASSVHKYRESPSAEAAHEAGITYIRLKEPELAAWWLEKAHDAGHSDATLKLIEIYAQGEWPYMYDGERAVQYAEALAPGRAPDDYEFLSLQASAYARAGNFMKAGQAMRKALDLNTTAAYETMFRHFKTRRTWPPAE